MEEIAKFVGVFVLLALGLSAIYAFIGWTIEPIWVHANWTAVRGCIVSVIGAVVLLYVVMSSISS